jgi:hypothetical protein
MAGREGSVGPEAGLRRIVVHESFLKLELETRSVPWTTSLLNLEQGTSGIFGLCMTSGRPLTSQESLAHSFEGVNLHEDALIVYEELEASFIQVLKEQNLSWFGKLGATSPNDDSLPILDVSRKRYRELLQTSQISIFDFRVYVFARQAVLLGRLGRITEIAKRGQWFVASLTRRLRESEVRELSSTAPPASL